MRTAKILQQQSVNLRQTEAARQLCMLHIDGLTDIRLFRRTRRDKPDANQLARQLPSCCRLALDIDSRGLHRRQHRHNLLDKLRKLHLNQAHNSRTGRRNQRLASACIVLDIILYLAGNIFRGQRNIKDFVEAQILQPLPDILQRNIIRELRIKRRCRQNYVIGIVRQSLERVSTHAERMIGTACSTGTAVNAAVAQDLRLAVTHADSFCRTQLYAGYAALTFFPLQSNRMKICCWLGSHAYHLTLFINLHFGAQSAW